MLQPAVVCDVNTFKGILEASQRLCLHMKKDSCYSEGERAEDVTDSGRTPGGLESTFGFLST